MINEDRVKHMTQMAIFEKNNSHKYQPMLKYRKNEYVALHGWAGFFAGTIVYLGLFAVAALEFVESMAEEFDLNKIMFFGAIGLLIYAAYIILHIHFTRRKAKIVYKEGNKLLKERRGQYDKLLSMYADEAQATRPTKLPDRIIKMTEEIEKKDWDNE